MKYALKSLSGCAAQGSARVVDGKLILSYPHALTPTVWQMDMAHAKASSLEVNEKAGSFLLVLKTPNGGATDIATFEKRTQAIDALMAASCALEKGQGQIRPASESGQAIYMTPEKKGGSKWIAVLLGLLLLFILFNVWGAMSPRLPSATEGTTSLAPVSKSDNQPENGVPLSADAVLNAK